MTEYAHPMGWAKAVVVGACFGSVLGGLCWLTWRGLTLAPVGRIGITVCVWFFVCGVSAVLLIESDERKKIRKRGAIDIREVLPK